MFDAAFSSSFMADSRRNISHSITIVAWPQPPTLVHVTLTFFPAMLRCYQPVSLVTPPRPFRVTLSDFLLPCINLYSIQLVLEKSLTHTCIWYTWWICFERKKNSAITCFSPSFFSFLFSISGVSVNKCQHCTATTVSSTHPPIPPTVSLQPVDDLLLTGS